MRLLNIRTYEIESFFDADIPPYAILSHTWGRNEVTFGDCNKTDPPRCPKGRSSKIDGCCEAVDVGFGRWRTAFSMAERANYVWIDTICIDKSSSAELSEAINSMFAWYRRSRFCLVYLEDVPDGEDIFHRRSHFRRSRWFTRGWTLQELLGPSELTFMSTSWTKLCAVSKELYGETTDEIKTRVLDLLEDITRIPGATLKCVFTSRMTHPTAGRMSLARKMSFVNGRSTSRAEDKSYSLLGILDINMPLLYGEEHRAFHRMQEELMRAVDDETLFAWGYDETPVWDTGLLASDPNHFGGCRNLVPYANPGFDHFTSTNRGVLMKIRVTKTIDGVGHAFGLLQVRDVSKDRSTVAIPLVKVREGVYSRPSFGVPAALNEELFGNEVPHWSKSIYILKGRSDSSPIPGLYPSGHSIWDPHFLPNDRSIRCSRWLEVYPCEVGADFHMGVLYRGLFGMSQSGSLLYLRATLSDGSEQHHFAVRIRLEVKLAVQNSRRFLRASEVSCSVLPRPFYSLANEFIRRGSPSSLDWAEGRIPIFGGFLMFDKNIWIEGSSGGASLEWPRFAFV